MAEELTRRSLYQYLNYVKPIFDTAVFRALQNQ